MKFNQGWIEAKETTFMEKVDEKSGKKKLYLISKILPKNKISRNKVKYNWESVLRTYEQIPGIPLNHNHKYKESNDLPRGEWVESWVEENYLCGMAEVYQTEYNKDYIEWLQNAKTISVSLNVGGESKVRKENLECYQEAYISNWREVSTVNIPGFLDAKGNLEVILSENLKEEVNPAVEEEDEPLDTEFDYNELKTGIMYELRITNDPYEAKSIAKKNLEKDKEYYKKLENEDEETRKNNVYIVKDKLDVISQRRYGRNYDSLLDKEKGKVLFSTDIEKSVNDEISRKLKHHYIKKVVDENAEKIINVKKEESVDVDVKSDEFFEKLDKSRFFTKLDNLRRI